MSGELTIQVIRKKEQLKARNVDHHSEGGGITHSGPIQDEYETVDEVIFSRVVRTREDLVSYTLANREEKRSDFVSRLSNFLSGSIPEEDAVARVEKLAREHAGQLITLEERLVGKPLPRSRA